MFGLDPLSIRDSKPPLPLPASELLATGYSARTAQYGLLGGRYSADLSSVEKLKRSPR
jgi:hypothetical protein